MNLHRCPPRLRPARALWQIAAFALLTMLANEPAAAQGSIVERVATGISRPVFLTAPPGDRQRVFLVEQHTGRIRILRLSDQAVLSPPFLTVPGISTGDEQGLLGLAFDPEYATNGFFYVYYTNPNSQIVRYQVSAVDPDLADGASAQPILSFNQPQANHNGGWIGFGPSDGLLYIATGDGGAGRDQGPGHTEPGGNAQDTTSNLLGKILRIDVAGDDFPADAARNYAIPPGNPFFGTANDAEIWAFGLRNPFRASFDRQTGDLYIGDVGQNTCEELNVQPAASAGGENYGWRLREGTIATPPTQGSSPVGGPKPPGAIDPIFDYPHSSVQTCRFSGASTAFLGFAITGGYVYRGPVSALIGRYFFADYGTGRLWSLRWDGSDPSTFDGTNYTQLTDHGSDPLYLPDQGEIASVSSFGEDDEGNLYVLDLFGGEIFRVPEPAPEPLFATAVVTLAAVAAMARARRPVGRGCGR